MSGLNIILAFAVVVALFVTFYPNNKKDKNKSQFKKH
ncbi:hypothetical protein CFVI03293_A0035 (plasmid) [Campylobacter fetus subsp. venerealis cfvi03/293]|nr:hypothetical protein CFVI03293_A0035 [Campylobacter fetus subsp. venerealis cfvi03/293]